MSFVKHVLNSLEQNYATATSSTTVTIGWVEYTLCLRDPVWVWKRIWKRFCLETVSVDDSRSYFQIAEGSNDYFDDIN